MSYSQEIPHTINDENIENGERYNIKRKFNDNLEDNDYNQTLNGISKLKKRKRFDIDINELDDEISIIKLFFRKRPRYDVHGFCKFEQDGDSDRIFCININIKNKINVKYLKDAIYSEKGMQSNKFILWIDDKLLHDDLIIDLDFALNGHVINISETNYL